MEWAIYNMRQLLNETVQRGDISIILKVKYSCLEFLQMSLNDTTRCRLELSAHPSHMR